MPLDMKDYYRPIYLDEIKLVEVTCNIFQICYEQRFQFRISDVASEIKSSLRGLRCK